MKKLAKLLISFGAGYAVGKMVEGTRKTELKDLKPLKIDGGDLKNMFEDMTSIKLDIKTDSIVSTISKIGEMKKEIEELKSAMNSHERYIHELKSHII